jgi:hypothetical protein
MHAGRMKRMINREIHKVSAMLVGVMIGMVAILATGCGAAATAEPGLAAVSGKVVVSRGVPLKGGRLVLKPVGGLRPAVSAEIRGDGSFAIDGVSQPAAVLPGEYEVYVVFGKSPKEQVLARQVPQRLQSLEDDDSGLVVRIDESAADVVIELKRG